MNLLKVVALTLVLVFFVIEESMSQFETSSPSIPKQEYFNPAFNAYKSYGSLNVMYRQQWVNGVNRAPSLLGVNLYVPAGKRGLGVGGTLISEEIGLRNVNTLLFSGSQGVRLSPDSYLALGVGVGLKVDSYQIDRIRSYTGIDLSQIERRQVNPVISFGMLALLRDVFMGVSTNLRVNDQDFDFTYITGFDFCLGRVFAINPDFVLRSIVVGKYYKETRYNSINGEITDEFIPPVVDWSTSCLFYNKLWIGTGVCFGQAAHLFVNSRLSSRLSLGYKYEVGIGSGLNRFNSQGIYLSYNFVKKRRRGRAYNSFGGVFSRSFRSLETLKPVYVLR